MNPRHLLLALGLAAARIACAASDLSQAEAFIAQGTNAFRAEQGLARLRLDPSLEAAAREFAGHMARTDRYGHEADGRAPSDRARAHGYDYCQVAENIAYQFSSTPVTHEELARRFLEGWKQSPGHRANILVPIATDMAVAVARNPATGRYYGVQMFARPRSQMVEFRVTSAARDPVEYRVGAEAFRLRPGDARVHTACGPEEVTFSRASSAAGRAFRPAAGDNLVVSGEGHFTIRVTR